MMLTDLQWLPLEERRRNARLHLLDVIVGGRVAMNHEDYVQRINTRDTINKQCQTEVHWCKNSYL